MSVSEVSVNTTRKALDSQSIVRHAQSSSKKDVLQYWRADKPSASLRLSGAGAHVRGDAMRASGQGANKFVYYPDLRIAGTAGTIANMLLAAGFGQSGMPVGQLNQLTGGQAGNQAGQVAVSLENILRNSFDPLNQAHLDIITRLAAAEKERAPSQARAPRDSRSLAEWLVIGEVLRKNGGKSRATSGTRGSRSKEVSRENKIKEFTELMDQTLAGVQLAKIINVTNFDGDKFTAVTKVAPATTIPGTTNSRSLAIRPRIMTQNGERLVPFSTQPKGAAAFRNYVNLVVRPSRYGNFADAILQSFEQMLASQYGGNAGLISSVPRAMAPVQQFVPQQYAAPVQQYAAPVQQFVPQMQAFQPQLGSTSPRSFGGAASPAPAAFGMPNVTQLPSTAGMNLNLQQSFTPNASALPRVTMQ